MLIGSYELIQSYIANPHSIIFSQSHSFSFDVRHNLLSSKESASSSCKAAYPFVQGSELVAVQIIAVDTERNSGLRKAGYLMKAGYPNQNTVSTGDLNRGRRVKPRLLFSSFCRSKKNVKPFPFGNFPLHGKLAPVGAAHCACYEASRFCKPRSSAASRHFPGRRGAAPYPVHAKRVQIHHTSRA